MSMSRREFVRSSLSAGVLAMLPFRFARADLLTQPAPSDASPLQRVDAREYSSSEFNGDDIERSHDILWDVDGYVRERGGLPAPSETANVVIIGGGLAGLYSAYLLRDLNPLVLEQDKVFGGNSKGEALGDSRYSLGAAYICAPAPDSETAALLKELGLSDKARGEAGDDATVFYKDRFSNGFWRASTDPKAQEDFARVVAEFKSFIARVESGSSDEPWLLELDKISFEQWLKETFGTIHQDLHEYFQLYAWSSFVASLDELSAAQMLNFIAYETETIMAFPGGNSAITAALYQKLVAELGRDRLRNSSLTVDVQADKGGVVVTYVRPDGTLQAVRAKACIFAAPKFVARRVVRGLTPEQEKAMEMIRYRGYVVANVFLDRRITAPCFDLYCMKGQVPPSPSAMNPSSRAFTDICFGSWADGDQDVNSVLTVYKAFAFDGDRQFLFAPGAHDKHKARVQTGLEPVLKALGVGSNEIKGIRMTRWGHSLPVAATGMLASGTASLASRPVAGKIFFANQDNRVNPSFETSTEVTRGAVAEVRALFG